MTQPASAPEARFAALVAAIAAPPRVVHSQGRGFGRSALKVDGKLFAVLVRGRLVVKLPAGRVSELVAAGEGDHLDTSNGRPMKEWLTLAPSSSLDWTVLAREAMTFVVGLH